MNDMFFAMVNALIAFGFFVAIPDYPVWILNATLAVYFIWRGLR